MVLKDSDWAGDVGGDMVCMGTHLVQFGSPLQDIIALSFGEAGLNAEVLGLCEGLGVASLFEFWGLPCVV